MEKQAQRSESLPVESANMPALESTAELQQKTCACLLETTLASANLPVSVAQRLRKQFNQKIFDPSHLQAAIDEARELVSDLTGAGVIQNPGRISGMVSPEDQISAAVHDMLGAKRPDGLANVQAARLERHP